MVSIEGVATEDSADLELIVSFGVCLICPLPAEVCILALKIYPHFVCRVQEDPIVERASASRVTQFSVCHGQSNKVAHHY
jgi:hypothetical protein